MPLNIIRNDLTRMACDAVVNPTDERLSGSGGVDAQLHRAAGAGLDRACARIGRCDPGSAVLTKGYDLPAKYVIHTVGPRWVDGSHGEAEVLAACYRSVLALARSRRFRSVALPIIAAGTFGFPKAQALEIAVREIRAFLRGQDMDVTLVVFNRECFEISAERYARVQAFIDQNYVDARSGRSNRRESDISFSMSFSEALPMSSARPEAKPSSRPKPRPAMRPSNAGAGPNRVLDESFSRMLLRKIDERGMTDAECYKKAGVDRKLFHKIRTNPNYRPSKVTAVAFAIALELDLEETRELLMKAGYALSHSQRFDVIIEYFILERIYDRFEINETLLAFDQQLIGA